MSSKWQSGGRLFENQKRRPFGFDCFLRQMSDTLVAAIHAGKNLTADQAEGNQPPSFSQSERVHIFVGKTSAFASEKYRLGYRHLEDIMNPLPLTFISRTCGLVAFAFAVNAPNELVAAKLLPLIFS